MTRKRSALTLFTLVALVTAPPVHATDTAFWAPYAADAKTYALLSFDGEKPQVGHGVAVGGEGSLVGGAQWTPEGKYGGGLRLDGTGRAAFATQPFNPGGMSIHSANLSFSIETWIKLDRLPEAGNTATIVHRDGPGAVGCTLFVDGRGALGMRVKPVGKPSTTFRSAAAAVSVGEWTHVAGVACGGHLSIGRDTLYVDGVEVFNGPGTGAVGTVPETGAATLFVGGSPDGNGLAGVIDEVRLHSLVGKLWPPDPMPWIARIAQEGLPPLDGVLARERQPLLSFPLDGDPLPVATAELQARDPAIVERFKVDFKGSFVPGVKGQAIRGRLNVSGYPLAHLTEGSLEFWARPHGVNNVSDRNLGVFSSSAFAAYFFNRVASLKPLSFYYEDAEKKLRMHGDGLGTELHPGRWYHVAFVWDANRITMYIDGQASASGENRMTTPANKGVLDRLRFNEQGAVFDIDELAVYGVRLTAAEIANRHWSFVAPEKITAAASPAPIRLDAWRMPSENAIVYRMSAMRGLEGVDQATLRLTDAKGAVVLAVERRFSSDFARLETPALPDGTYTLDAVATVDGKESSAEPICFLEQRLPWEGNTLGLTDEVFSPFTPVKTDGDTVSVVLRDYRMNGFGLWDSVVSQGRELLAAPIRLRYETEGGGEGAWTFGKGRFDERQPHRAAYRARAASPAVTIEAISEIEMDGMMKVTLTLAPPSSQTSTPKPRISRLWLEVPLKASEATLMHEDTGTLRRNYSGFVPEGAGSVWQARRRGGWRNAFCGYLWLGGEERGLAWFAENDKGWITEKSLSDRPLQEIVRQGDCVVIRVNLVDVPATITEPRTLVFGLQASPAKPMPEDWRTGARGGGLPVTPWGGHQCADKFPFEDRWEIVDRIVEQQLTGKSNGEWFRDIQKAHDIPPLRGTESWLKSVGHFAGLPKRPTLVYFEEMSASTYRTEWHVFKDEWSNDLLDSRRPWPMGYDVFRQGKPADCASRVTFGPSYRDYGAWYANEWLKRGIGIYWDNTYLTTTSNPLVSEAYMTEDGQIQPALTLWNQREYSKRVWNLMQLWMRARKEKLLFLQHMTNTALLPILAWSTTAFDNEFSAASYARGVAYPRQHRPTEPFPPDYLRAQSLGRAFGCYPALCHSLFTPADLDPTLIPADEIMAVDGTSRFDLYKLKREWGMSRVHDIPANPGYRIEIAKLEGFLRGFGYGTDRVAVHNYWAEQPALRVDREDVKWLLVARPSDKRLLLVLQSWSRNPGPVQARFDFGVIGFRPEGGVANLETGTAIPLDGTGFDLDLKSAYDFKLLDVGAVPPPADVLFTDAFSDAPSPRWNYVSTYFDVHDTDDGRRALRLGENMASWCGPGRIELWDGTDRWRDGTLELDFRFVAGPTGASRRLTVITRAGRPVWSREGLSHTRLGNGQFTQLRANGETGRWELTRWTTGADGKRGPATTVTFGDPDNDWHTLATVLRGPASRVLFDGVEVASFGETPDLGGAFGIQALNLSDTSFMELDRVTFRAPSSPGRSPDDAEARGAGPGAAVP